MRATRSTAIVLGLASCLLIGAGNLAAQPPANPTGTSVLEFHKRLEAYVAARARAADNVPKLRETPSPAEIDARERAMATALRTARGGARPGDLFGPVDSLIRTIVRDDWARRSAADRRALAAEVPRVTRLAINTTYPSDLPLATVPPTLLQELPRLPDSLEYRLMGRYLVLRDVTANLVVDYLERAIPSR